MKKIILLLLVITMEASIAGAYPLNTCVISGEKLGEMGTPYVFKYKDVEVQLCCEKCKPKFDKNPAKYLAKIAEASQPGN